MNTIHLICNAHLDPVWLWRWEEGAGEALSTFRTAVRFCEEENGFIFNHNEALLYEWVEEYEPALFERIKKLVVQGKWHIMGGWYLQPDCNLPSGESFIRQILAGHDFFQSRFNCKPSTAINFDSFGHSRGLVQILKKSGYDAYLFCRPDKSFLDLKKDDFIWVGYDGSEIAGHRAFRYYLSKAGKVDEKIRDYMDKYSENDTGLILWGIGNHGGGPSRKDLELISQLKKEDNGFELNHSTPESYFKKKNILKRDFPKVHSDLNPFSVGCYTSQVKIKQKHNCLENELYSCEKMISHAVSSGLLDYPEKELKAAQRDLLFAQFHDILPGTSMERAYDDSLRLMDHGLEILSRLKAKAFFALCSGQEKGEDGGVPLFVYNPHARALDNQIIEVEFMRPPVDLGGKKSLVRLFKDGREIPCQMEKEESNLKMDWRKKISFFADLPGGKLSRFDCRIEGVEDKTLPVTLEEDDHVLIFKTEELEIHFNRKTGEIEKWLALGISWLNRDAMIPIVLNDNDDAWYMKNTSFGELKGRFLPMTGEEGAAFSGLEDKTLSSVRIIENGTVRTIIELLWKYENSSICQRYFLPKKGTVVDMDMRVYWHEKSSLLKLPLSTPFQKARCWGQKVAGCEVLQEGKEEKISQRWDAIENELGEKRFVCLNRGVYGSHFEEGSLYLSLLRSPLYSGHPVGDLSIGEEARFSPRIDQGERIFQFRFDCLERQNFHKIDQMSQSYNETPYVMTFCPSGEGEKPGNSIGLSDEAVIVTAFKKREKGDGFIIRLFEPTGQVRETELIVPHREKPFHVKLSPFEMKTLLWESRSGNIREVAMTEEQI